MRIPKKLGVAAIAAASISLTPLANSYEYSYGEIPVTTTLCGGIKSDIGLQTGAGGNFAVEGEAGVGVTFIGKAKLTAKIEPTLSAAGVSRTSATLQSTNCIEVINTKTELSFDNLDVAQQFLLEGLLTDSETGEKLDDTDLAMELITSATAFNATVPASQAGIETFGIITSSITDAITGADPLDLQSSINTVTDIADSASGVIHPKILNALQDPEALLMNHLSQLDFISSSCMDLTNGEIENITEVMLEAIADACLLVADTQEELEKFVNGTVSVAQSGADAAEEIGEILTDGQTVQSITKGIDDNSREIGDTIDKIEFAINNLEDTVQSGERLITGAIDAGESIIKGSFDSVSATVEDLTGTLAVTGSSGSSSLQLLQGEIDTTIDLISNLSLSAVTELPGKLASVAADAAAEAVAGLADELCSKEIKVGFVKIDIEDIPVISNILGC